MSVGSRMELHIRKATQDDAPFLAWLILTAGRAHVKRGIWEVILNLPENDCLAFLRLLAVTDTPHLFHYSCYLIAEVETKPVAGLGGYDPNINGYHALQKALPEVFSKIGTFPPGKMALEEPPKITGCIPPTLEGTWVIDSVATHPDFRRRGIAGKLLDSIFEIGRGKGFRQAQISIYLGNIPAQRAYEKQGFKLLDEWCDPYFERETGSPGMARLVCDL
jgi:ribosomal protein S18 acetylase RimI-like enzyme